MSVADPGADVEGRLRAASSVGNCSTVTVARPASEANTAVAASREPRSFAAFVQSPSIRQSAGGGSDLLGGRGAELAARGRRPIGGRCRGRGCRRRRRCAGASLADLGAQPGGEKEVRRDRSEEQDGGDDGDQDDDGSTGASWSRRRSGSPPRPAQACPRQGEVAGDTPHRRRRRARSSFLSLRNLGCGPRHPHRLPASSFGSACHHRS